MQKHMLGTLCFAQPTLSQYFETKDTLDANSQVGWAKAAFCRAQRHRYGDPGGRISVKIITAYLRETAG